MSPSDAYAFAKIFALIAWGWLGLLLFLDAVRHIVRAARNINKEDRS